MSREFPFRPYHSTLELSLWNLAAVAGVMQGFSFVTFWTVNGLITAYVKFRAAALMFAVWSQMTPRS